jgi:hypothetical protein
VQHVALAAMTASSRARSSRRRRPLPPLGTPAHLTSILRIEHPDLPRLALAERHYVYPASTVHVTVANLDAARIDVDRALERLRDDDLEAPQLRIGRLGCSPDTLFLRCTTDDRFERLRRAVRAAFGVEPAAPPATRLFERLAVANVARFDGPGEWARVRVRPTLVECRELQIVRTDRYLSDAGTVVVARIPLAADPAVRSDQPPSG